MIALIWDFHKRLPLSEREPILFQEIWDLFTSFKHISTKYVIEFSS